MEAIVYCPLHLIFTPLKKAPLNSLSKKCVLGKVGGFFTYPAQSFTEPKHRKGPPAWKPDWTLKGMDNTTFAHPDERGNPLPSWTTSEPLCCCWWPLWCCGSSVRLPQGTPLSPGPHNLVPHSLHCLHWCNCLWSYMLTSRVTELIPLKSAHPPKNKAKRWICSRCRYCCHPQPFSLSLSGGASCSLNTGTGSLL